MKARNFLIRTIIVVCLLLVLFLVKKLDLEHAQIISSILIIAAIFLPELFTKKYK